MRQLVRSTYNILPFKREIFAVLRKFVGLKERHYKHLHFKGIFDVEIDEQHSFRMRHYGFELENSIFWEGIRGGWEKASVSLWIKLVSDAKVILDIGANTGVYSLIAKSLNPASTVLALEPIERVFEKLEANNALNGYDIVCLPIAASNANGTATVYDAGGEHVYSVTVNKNLASSDVAVIPTVIQTMRLDRLIEEQKLDRLDLLKIDVETHEPEVLEGLGDYLDQFRPTMLIEILNDEVGTRVEALVKGKDYLYFNIDETSQSVRHVQSITTSDYYNYLLCTDEVAKRLGLSISAAVES